jgi:hypothetical protein
MPSSRAAEEYYLMRLQNERIEDFEPIITDLYQSTFAAELQSKRIIFPSKTSYLQNCYSNYNIGQIKVSNLIVTYYNDKKQAQIKIKGLRTNKNKAENKLEISELKSKIECYENRILVLRRLIDSMACKLFEHKLWMMRRFVFHKENREIDISAVINNIKIASDYNFKNPFKFALVSDLTTFIHVGDLILISNESGEPKWKICELKTGQINKELLNVAESSSTDVGLDKHKKDQLNRIIRQKDRSKKVINLINTNKGFNIQTNEPLELLEENTEISYCVNALKSAIAGANSSKIALCIVEDCFYILASRLTNAETLHYIYHLIYANQECFIGKDKGTKNRLNEIKVVQNIVNHPYVRDLTYHNMKAHLRTPFFVLPIENVMFDLLFNRMRILLYLDINKFRTFSELRGYRIEQITKKITNIAKSRMPNVPLIEGKALKAITPKGREMYIGDGLFNKMFFDLVTPSSILAIISNYCDHNSDSQIKIVRSSTN